MKRKSFYVRYFVCPICGFKRAATKRSDRKTAVGHNKKMFCFKCGCEQQFVQTE